MQPNSASKRDDKLPNQPQNASSGTERRSSEPSRDGHGDSPMSSKQSDTAASRLRLGASDVGQGYVPQLGQDGPFSSWSSSSEKQLGYNSPDPADRVYPIRSAISVDPTQTPFQGPLRTSGEYDGFPGFVPVAHAGTESGSHGRMGGRVSGGSQEVEGPSGRAGRSVTDPQASNDGRASVTFSRKERQNSVSTSRSDGVGLYAGGARDNLFNDATSDRSGRSSYNPSTKSEGQSAFSDTSGRAAEEDHSGLVTARFKHIVNEDGHAIITGRDGETLQRCEDEPIHIPGAVQGFGLLVALKEEGDGQLVVRVVSENSRRMIGFSPEELFQLNSFTDILSEEQADNLLDHVDFIKDEEADPATNGPEVFTLSIKPPKKRSVKLWCAMHINPSYPDVIICEFELDDDQIHPLMAPHEETPEPPEDTLDSQPTEEEYTESTQISSKPLRVLRSARKRKGEAAAMEVFNIMSQVQEQLANAPNLEIFLKILVGVVRELTGFHRVMIYQFDASFNGRVVTELVDPLATKDLYKGLNFPASDIPKQARELYKKNKVRLLYDRDLETARLVCRTLADLETPLDLSYSYLRAMSPIHIKYLANMAVRSSMSISINAFNELWGLIACHGYGSKGMRVSFPIRKMCRLIGDTASRNLERLSYASRLQARKLINTVPTESNPSGYIIASSDDLLKLFDADFGLLSIRGETKIMGVMEHTQEALAMVEYLRLRSMTSVVTSQDIKVDFPDLRYQPGFQVIAGLLLVPLSVGGGDFIVFFRKGQIKEVKWAGNPYEKFIKEGTEGYLEPRKSFKTWSETVIGKCREWTEEQVETAAVLCLVYGKFIEVWRQKEAALQSSQLTRILLANSAHEVRTPLNAIINYLEIALEGALDQETRDNLAKSHSASKSLIYVINDLLDLTKTEEGQELVKDEAFDLCATVRDATDSFKGDARRKGIDYEVIEHPGIPPMVLGDSRRVRQAVAALTANAVQHTTKGGVRIEIWQSERAEDRAAIDIVVQDTGCGMSDQELDTLFRDLEQVSTDEDNPLNASTEVSKPQLADGKNKRLLGLGLATVARIVRNMDGQLRLKSEEGKGSRFAIQLSFELPAPESGGSDHTIAGSVGSGAQAAPGSSTPPPTADGEVMLVDNASSSKVDVVARKRSLEDISSLSSFKSGSSGRSLKSNKSDVDRLIDAISEPLNVGRPESEELGAMRLNRSNSRGSGNSRKSAGSLGSGQLASRPSSLKQSRRSSSMTTSRSQGSLVPEHLRTSYEGPPGSEFVTDNKTLLTAVRVPDEYQENSRNGDDSAQPHTASRVLFDIPDKPNQGEPRKQNAEHLQVLVAEDDPVNSKIIIKRLEKTGHSVYHTVNGEECASAYGDKPAFFDLVLMDMQMPIVDGLTSTKMIRSFEKTHHQKPLSPRAKENGRVPIFAVSASLLERERQNYINAGFDGWILKPIDFKRLNVLFAGIVEEDTRNECLYKPGQWERGGWFQKRQPHVTDARTAPSNEPLATNTPPNSFPARSLDESSAKTGGSGSSAESEATTPTTIAETKKSFYDERESATVEEIKIPEAVIEDQAVEDVTD